MREDFFGTKSIRTDLGATYTLDYYIIIKEIALDNDISIESYGIKIIMKNSEKGESPVCYAEIPNIYMNSLEIYKLIMLLSECTVTPTSVYEILDDCLAK